jgi:ABC-type branched-subunit amino acid transport system permease subunit
MDQDTEHLRLLAIFHYVVAGLAGLFSFFPLLYVAMGIFFVVAPQHMSANSGEPPPEIVGWFFLGFGAFFFLIGICVAVLILLAGRFISRRRHYLFALVAACIECLFMPFGTVLGVFTIVVLSRPSVKALFGVEPVRN